jgi:hypothetical protein
MSHYRHFGLGQIVSHLFKPSNQEVTTWCLIPRHTYTRFKWLSLFQNLCSHMQISATYHVETFPQSNVDYADVSSVTNSLLPHVMQSYITIKICKPIRIRCKLRL